MVSLRTVPVVALAAIALLAAAPAVLAGPGLPRGPPPAAPSAPGTWSAATDLGATAAVSTALSFAGFGVGAGAECTPGHATHLHPRRLR